MNLSRDHFFRVVTIAIFSVGLGLVLMFGSETFSTNIERGRSFSGGASYELAVNAYITSFIVVGGLIAAFGFALGVYLLTKFDSIPRDDESEETL